MKSMQKMKVLKGALVLVAVLAMAGTAWAKKNKNGPGLPGDLSQDRTTVTLSVPLNDSEGNALTCDDTMTANQDYTVQAYILQPSGRILAIGMGTTDTFTCISGGTLPLMVEDVTVYAFPGLTFKPGPATVLYKVTLTDSTIDPSNPTVTVVYEYGSRVDLHPNNH